MCLNSLRLADGFRREHVHRVRFVQMNLFRPPVSKRHFDVVLCNGVLHHTSDPKAGFKSLVSLVKPGDHIVIGLYKYGRVLTDSRRLLFRLTNGAGKWIDPYLRSAKISAEKQRASFADQYLHPHESKQTIGEVLRWFEEEDVLFVNAVPPLTDANGDFEARDS